MPSWPILARAGTLVKLWSHGHGRRGWRVRVMELYPGSNLYITDTDPDTGKPERTSLKHRDRARAIDQCEAAAAMKRRGLPATPAKKTLRDLTDAYLKKCSKYKSAGEEGEDKRRVAMLLAFFGEAKDPASLSVEEWEDFKRKRRSGQINGRGTEASTPMPVSFRALERDCLETKRMFAWGAEFGSPAKGYLIPVNPFTKSGYGIRTGQKVPPPIRPVATAERYEKLRDIAHLVRTETQRGSSPELVPSTFAEILELARWMGRRRSAICTLSLDCIHLDYPRPFGLEKAVEWEGALDWPGDRDKISRDWITPLDAHSRRAIRAALAKRPKDTRSPWLFCSPTDPMKHLAPRLASRWFQKAETLAQLPHLPHGAWHSFRRFRATELLDAGVRPGIVARLLGWKNEATMWACYDWPNLGETANAVNRAMLATIAVEETNDDRQSGALGPGGGVAV